MRLKLSKEQWSFVYKLGIEDREYTENEIDDYVIETIYKHLMLHGWKPGTDYEETNEIGDLCESIIDAIKEQRH